MTFINPSDSESSDNLQAGSVAENFTIRPVGAGYLSGNLLAIPCVRSASDRVLYVRPTRSITYYR